MGKTTIEVSKKTTTRIQRAKYKFGYKTADETINKIFDISEKVIENRK